MLQEFAGDDSAYLSWIAKYPDGFVLNVRRTADPDYVVLHRATCGSISNSARATGAYTERGYRKVCGESVKELEKAAQHEGRADGSFSKRCGLCRP